MNTPKKPTAPNLETPDELETTYANLARIEAAFGEIKVPQQSLADQLFRPPQPPEPPSENE